MTVNQPTEQSSLGAFLAEAFDRWEKHSAEVGAVVISWTALQEALGAIFARIVTRDAFDVGKAAWYAIKSDRAQREMLAAAAPIALGSDNPAYLHIKWGLNQLNALEDNRNDAAHSPYQLRFEDRKILIEPSAYTGNPRAAKLKDRDLSKELHSYDQKISAMLAFFVGIMEYMNAPSGSGTLPPKPSLPRTVQSMTPKAARPQNSPK